jgi:hypothetical protein
MSDRPPEREWKYMRKIMPDLLNTLADRINQESLAILSEEATSAHERYLKLFRHIHDSDEVVAECFDDWRRSRLLMRLISLRRHGLLTDEHMENLSEQTCDTIKALKELWD